MATGAGVWALCTVAAVSTVQRALALPVAQHPHDNRPSGMRPRPLRNGGEVAIIARMGNPVAEILGAAQRVIVSLLAFIVLVAWSGDADAGADQGHVEVHTFHSRVFDTQRTLLVWVPGRDSTATERLPLLVSFQGENLFDADGAAANNDWAVDDLLGREPSGIPRFLVVGLVSAPHAVREFATPGSRPDAQAPLLMRCLIDEVLPFVEARWRVSTQAAGRYLMGMGNSGWTAVYGAWAHAAVFGGALAFDLPDVDPQRTSWPLDPPQQPSPWLWLEQMTAERSRGSNSGVLAALRRGGDVHVVVAGPRASRPARLAAALRAIPVEPGRDADSHSR
jgi:enterochelin esterase-like enzyme